MSKTNYNLKIHYDRRRRSIRLAQAGRALLVAPHDGTFAIYDGITGSLCATGIATFRFGLTVATAALVGVKPGEPQVNATVDRIEAYLRRRQRRPGILRRVARALHLN